MFGNFELFSNIGFMVNGRDRIGLVGKNGAGKTTLLKIMNGQIQPTSGSVSIPSGIRIGYLPQHLNVSDSGRSVFEEAEEAFTEIKELEREIKTLQEALSSRNDYHSSEYEKLIQSLSLANDKYHLLKQDNTEASVVKTLKGLGFTDAELNRKTAEFSGGWRMRIELAKILLLQPDVLLLDEPTNHLDIIAIQWLEEFLKQYPGAVLIISHDRTFLDNITTRTIELSLGKLYDYKVPYSQFVALREERLKQQKAAYNNQMKMITETQEFIDRFRYKATKANQVQSRIKQLEKIELVNFDEIDTKSIHFRFPQSPRSGSIVFETISLGKEYSGHIVLNEIDFSMERGDKIALVGRNGEGKSTFSKIVAGELDYSGTLKKGNNLHIGYYAQNQEEMLDGELTVLETLDYVAIGDIRSRLREILGSFLFRGDDIDKKVKVLSGGEKSRLALARLILEPYNLIILDEPTNHLDMQSKDILRDALMKYDGSLLIVSHDRYFLNGLVNKVYEVMGTKIKEEPGGINAYIKRYRKQIQMQLFSYSKPPTKNKEENTEQKQIYIERKELEKTIRKIRNEHHNHEKQIELLEQQINDIEIFINSPDKYKEPRGDVYLDYEKLKKRLESEMHLWEKTGVELIRFESIKQQ